MNINLLKHSGKYSCNISYNTKALVDTGTAGKFVRSSVQVIFFEKVCACVLRVSINVTVCGMVKHSR